MKNSNGRRLVPNGSSLRPASSRTSLSGHRSTSSLRQPSPPSPQSLGDSLGDDDRDGNGDIAGGTARFSLAHELAAALMPEPSAGSKLLADEFGIEFDEGAEGIDEDVPVRHDLPQDDGSSFSERLEDRNAPSDEEGTAGRRSPEVYLVDTDEHSPQMEVFSTPPSRHPVAVLFDTPAPKVQIARDPLEQFSDDFAATEAFVSRLRYLDSDSSALNMSTSSSLVSTEPPVERYTSRMIRQLNDTVREREGQVRELIAMEKEFRKIGSELGGSEVLASLDELEEVEGLSDDAEGAPKGPSGGHLQPLNGIAEEDDDEDDDDGYGNDDELVDGNGDGEDVFGSASPRRLRPPAASGLPALPRPKHWIPTPSGALPHLAHMRAVTSSLVNSLSAISEHAQENSAATADAGRKLRALKNRITGWRSDWESAERSQERIEKWERGDGGVLPVDGRKIVEEQLNAFALVLAEAAIKTQAIMAAA
jgi:hypothetical protein